MSLDPAFPPCLAAFGIARLDQTTSRGAVRINRTGHSFSHGPSQRNTALVTIEFHVRNAVVVENHEPANQVGFA